MPTDKRTGKCEGCGKNPRQLIRIESGQWICLTCLSELRPKRPKHLATWKQIAEMRQGGFDVGEDLTKERVRVLRKILKARDVGIEIGDDASEPEVDGEIAIAQGRAFIGSASDSM